MANDVFSLEAAKSYIKRFTNVVTFGGYLSIESDSEDKIFFFFKTLENTSHFVEAQFGDIGTLSFTVSINSVLQDSNVSVLTSSSKVLTETSSLFLATSLEEGDSSSVYVGINLKTIGDLKATFQVTSSNRASVTESSLLVNNNSFVEFPLNKGYFLGRPLIEEANILNSFRKWDKNYQYYSEDPVFYGVKLYYVNPEGEPPAIGESPTDAPSKWIELATAEIPDNDISKGAKTPQVFNSNSLVVGTSTSDQLRSNSLDVGYAYPSSLSRVYHLDGDYTDQNGENTLTVETPETPEVEPFFVEKDSIVVGLTSIPAIDFKPFLEKPAFLYGNLRISQSLTMNSTNALDFYIKYPDVDIMENESLISVLLETGENLDIFVDSTSPTKDLAVRTVLNSSIVVNPLGTNTNLIRDSWGHLSIEITETSFRAVFRGKEYIQALQTPLTSPFGTSVVINPSMKPVCIDELLVDTSTSVPLVRYEEIGMKKMPWAANEDSERWLIVSPYSVDKAIIPTPSGSNIKSIVNIDYLNKSKTDCILKTGLNLDINYTDTTLTLKAGSTVCYPDGNISTLGTDVSRSIDYEGIFLLFFDGDTTFEYEVSNTCFSADRDPVEVDLGWSSWYNYVSRKLFKNIGYWIEVPHWSIPFAQVTVEGGKIVDVTKLDYVSYFGLIVFGISDCEFLLPNGFNEDGTLKNYKVKSVFTQSGYISGTNLVLNGGALPYALPDYSYNPTTNLSYGATLVQPLLYVGEIAYNYNSIISVFLRRPFRTADIQDNVVSENTVKSSKWLDTYLPYENIDFLDNRNAHTYLTAGEDLNSFTKAGKVVCQADAIAATLKNCPINSAFYMTTRYTLSTETNYFLQDLVTWTNEKYSRRYELGSGWSPWEKQGSIFTTFEQLGIDSTSSSVTMLQIYQAIPDRTTLNTTIAGQGIHNIFPTSYGTLVAIRTGNYCSFTFHDVLNSGVYTCEGNDNVNVSPWVQMATLPQVAQAQTNAIGFTQGYGVGSNAAYVPNADWNQVTASGYYMYAGAANAPEGDSRWFMGYCIVHNSSYQEQVLTDFASGQQIYRRFQNNGAWGAWYHTVTNESNNEFTSIPMSQSAAKNYSNSLFSVSSPLIVNYETVLAQPLITAIAQTTGQLMVEVATNTAYIASASISINGTGIGYYIRSPEGGYVCGNIAKGDVIDIFCTSGAPASSIDKYYASVIII